MLSEKLSDLKPMTDGIEPITIECRKLCLARDQLFIRLWVLGRQALAGGGKARIFTNGAGNS